MPQITINGQTYKAIGEAFGVGGKPCSNGIFYALPPYGNPPRMGPPEYDYMIVDFEGIDGVWTKNRGFRGRNIYVQLMIINQDKPSTEQALDNLQDSVTQQARYTITMPGGTVLMGCKLVTGMAEVISEDNWGGETPKIVVVVSLHFRQLSFTNG